MPFMLGSFADGLFGSMRSVADLAGAAVKLKQDYDLLGLKDQPPPGAPQPWAPPSGNMALPDSSQPATTPSTTASPSTTTTAPDTTTSSTPETKVDTKNWPSSDFQVSPDSLTKPSKTASSDQPDWTKRLKEGLDAGDLAQRAMALPTSVRTSQPADTTQPLAYNPPSPYTVAQPPGPFTPANIAPPQQALPSAPVTTSPLPPVPVPTAPQVAAVPPVPSPTAPAPGPPPAMPTQVATPAQPGTPLGPSAGSVLWGGMTGRPQVGLAGVQPAGTATQATPTPTTPTQATPTGTTAGPTATPTEPTAPTPAASNSSLGGRILSYLNPISTAQAAEARPGQATGAPAALPGTAPVTTVGNAPAGMIQPGNIDLNNRPVVRNADGSVSTVRSMSFNENGREVLVPTVSPDGRILSPQEAVDLYHKTGQHLGQFQTPEQANAYAQQLHKQQEQQYAPAAQQTPQRTALPERPTQGGPTVTTTAANTAVAPHQQAPTQQSEPTPPQPVREHFDTQPYARLNPEQKAMVDRVAAEERVNPARLALHWWLESRLHPTSAVSSAGAEGVMQVIPSTRTEVDPQHKLDPNKLEDSLHLGARYINKLDGRFGQDSPTSILAYHSGPEKIADVQANPGANPRGVQYLTDAFPGRQQSTLLASLNPKGIQVDGKQAVQTLATGDPNTVLHMVAQTAQANNVGLSDAWRAWEQNMMGVFMERGDIKSAMMVREYVAQMSHQGTLISLQNAYNAYRSGNPTAVAQQLARGHAFFPDGQMGRFAVDDKGNVWGQAFDEHDPSKPLGAPMKITPDDIMGQMITLSNPNNFVQALQEQQLHASQIRLNAAHEYYLRTMPDVKEAKVALDLEKAQHLQEYQSGQLALKQQQVEEQERRNRDWAAHQQELERLNAQRAAETAEHNRQTELYRQAVVQANAEKLANDKHHQDTVSKESQELFDETHTTGVPAEQRGTAAQLYYDMRMNNADLAPQNARDIALGLTGRTLRAKQSTPDKEGNYTFRIYDPKTGVTRAYLPKSSGYLLAGFLEPEQNQQRQPTPVAQSALPVKTPPRPPLLGAPIPPQLTLYP